MLIDVIDNVAVRLLARGITAPVLFGGEHIKAHGAGGVRIVVDPTEDTFGDGPTFDFNGEHSARQKGRISRAAGADVWLWGVPTDPKASTAKRESIASAEALLHAFLHALREVVRGQYRLLRGRWLTPAEAGAVVYGAAYVVAISVDVPVVDPALLPLPTPTTFDPTFHLGASTEAG